MTRSTSNTWISIVGVALIFVFTQPAAAHAYIDPGTGLFVLQGVISVVLGGIFLAREKVKYFFDVVLRRKRPKDPVDSDAVPDKPDDLGSKT